MNEGQFLKKKLKEGQKKKSFDDKTFWTNIGTNHTSGYQMCKLPLLKEPYRSNVEKQFGIKFPDAKQEITKEFAESKKDIVIRKQENKIRDLENTVISKDTEIKILEDELLLYKSLKENKFKVNKNKQ